jgi:hypothetical protein
MFKKTTLVFLPMLVIITAIGCQPAAPARIDRHPAAFTWNRGSLTTLPHYDPNSTDGWQVDLRSYDLSNLDLSQSLNDLLYADFDTQTKWPPSEKMPSGYDWQQIMALGKNPGLGVRSLHAQGIDGLNIGIAIIDSALLVDHPEFATQVRMYEEINIRPAATSEMHGLAVASIAVGKTTGVAPKADLYYIAADPGDSGTGGSFTYNFHYIAQAIQRILEINRGLQAGHRIRVISISDGWSPEYKGYSEITAAVKSAKNAGILVVSSSLEETYGYKFQGLGRPPLADPDRFESYEPGIWWANYFYANAPSSDRLLVPMDSRTTAGPGGIEDYAFYRQGGWSWSIPYIAGVYALAAQVKPTITPDEFWATALKTGRTIQLTHDQKTIPFGPIIDPVALMAALNK